MQEIVASTFAEWTRQTAANPHELPAQRSSTPRGGALLGGVIATTDGRPAETEQRLRGLSQRQAAGAPIVETSITKR
jgi:hypothetical protein